MIMYLNNFSNVNTRNDSSNNFICTQNIENIMYCTGQKVTLHTVLCPFTCWSQRHTGQPWPGVFIPLTTSLKGECSEHSLTSSINTETLLMTSLEGNCSSEPSPARVQIKERSYKNCLEEPTWSGPLCFLRRWHQVQYKGRKVRWGVTSMTPAPRLLLT